MKHNNGIQTGQKTSKHLKGHILLSSITMVIGILIFCIWTFVAHFSLMTSAAELQESKDGAFYVWSIVFGLSFIWFIITKFRIWWNHG